MRLLFALALLLTLSGVTAQSGSSPCRGVTACCALSQEDARGWCSEGFHLQNKHAPDIEGASNRYSTVDVCMAACLSVGQSEPWRSYAPCGLGCVVAEVMGSPRASPVHAMPRHYCMDLCDNIRRIDDSYQTINQARDKIKELLNRSPAFACKC